MTELLQLIAEAHEASTGSVPRERLEYAMRLAEFEKLSKRQIATIVGLGPMDLQGVIDKSSRTGGTLTIEAIPVVIGAAGLEGEALWDKVYEAYTLGASVNFIADTLELDRNKTWYEVKKRRRAS